MSNTATLPANRQPGLSIVVPVRNDPVNLERCLSAIAASTYASYEVIVVDDASTDETADVARSHGVQVVLLPNQAGPATARNRGAAQARNPYLFFVDADVSVRPDTLSLVAEQIVRDPRTPAFFGSYDARPGASNLVSQYRNLLHHHIHQTGDAEASTFWSGCGVIERSVFLELGGFDVAYANASIEDIELGGRLRRAGHRIALVPHIQVKHWKRWTFSSMVRTDIEKRGIPWTLLILRQGKIPNDLNLRHSQRVSALFAGAAVATVAAGSWFHPSLLGSALVVLLCLWVIDRLTDARPVPRPVRLAGSALLAVLIPLVLVATPVGRDLVQPWSIATVGLLGGIVALNLRFYRFFATEKHIPFALAVLPLHILYFLCSGFAFAVGTLLHWTRDRRRESAS